MATRKKSVHVHLNALQIAQLERMTKLTGAPRAALIRMALDKFLLEALAQ